MIPTSTESLIHKALHNRAELISALHTEETDTYRLFHGANEGFPGLTIDRYGDRILVQSFYESPSDTDRDQLQSFLNPQLDFEPTYDFRDRSVSKTVDQQPPDKPTNSSPFSSELGVRYLTKTSYRGQDPYLFLDMRATRRYLLANSRDLSVLNLFAYTCSLGLCAAMGGAAEVWNIDFAESALEVGRTNLLENRAPEFSHQMIREDFFPAIRQLAGMQVKGRGRRKKYGKYQPRTFDLVLLDPPRWATSSFGAVDLIRDYQSVFKPALLVTKPGGRIICTNHVPSVSLDAWLEILEKCALKNSCSIDIAAVITPEEDFPSPDGKHPLKIAVIDRK